MLVRTLGRSIEGNANSATVLTEVNRAPDIQVRRKTTQQSRMREPRPEIQQWAGEVSEEHAPPRQNVAREGHYDLLTPCPSCPPERFNYILHGFPPLPGLFEK